MALCHWDAVRLSSRRCRLSAWLLGAEQKGTQERSSCNVSGGLPTDQPFLPYAGLRIDPETFSRSRMGYYTGITFAPFTDDLVRRPARCSVLRRCRCCCGSAAAPVGSHCAGVARRSCRLLMAAGVRLSIHHHAAESGQLAQLVQVMPVAADAAHKVTGIPDGFWVRPHSGGWAALEWYAAACWPRQAAHGLACCVRVLLIPLVAFIKHGRTFALPCPPEDQLRHVEP